MKQRITLLILFTFMFLGLFDTTSFAALSPEIIELQYDDYIGLNGEIQIDTENMIVEWDAAKNKLHAKAVGNTTILVDGKEKTIIVKKAKVNIVLISGQSNAAGEAGTLDGINPECTDIGYGYYYLVKTGELEDLYTIVKDKAETPVTGTNTYYNSVGFYPSLAKRWYELTGEKVVIIHDGQNGAPISHWATEDGVTSHTTTVTQNISKCISLLKQNGNYEIIRSGYYWLQGESNASIDDLGLDYIQYTTPSEYSNAYIKMHEAYVKALSVEGCPAPVGGIMSVRTRENLNTWKPNEYCGVRTAQQDLANQNDDIYMASVITEEWLSASGDKDKFSTQGGAIHYSQKGYNILGEDAANNMYAALTSGASKDFILYAHDGKTIYEENDIIFVDDNMRPIGNDNTREKGAAQIAVRTLPITSRSNRVAITLTDSNGNPVTGVIDNNGYISDASKITEAMTLTVEANGVSKKYKLTSKAAEMAFVKSGDIDKNGMVDINDVIRLINHINKSNPLADACSGDVNGDGKTSILDIVKILNLI